VGTKGDFAGDFAGERNPKTPFGSPFSVFGSPFRVAQARRIEVCLRCVWGLKPVYPAFASGYTETGVSIPRHNPFKALTMGGIVQDAGLTVKEFRKLL
jgi:hypothetical protein